MEYKSIQTENKLIGDRTVEGFANVSGVLDFGNDRVMARAFKKTIKEQAGKVRHLWQHDNRQPPVALITELEEVDRDGLPAMIQKKFPEATGGLRVVREYLDTERGNEVLAGVKSGAINEMSIGYDAVKVDFKEEEQEENGLMVRTRLLREVRLWDTSDVNWGMNPATVAAKGKVVIPFKATGTSTSSWSRPGLGSFTNDSWEDISTADKRRIANHFAWSAASPPAKFGDLKLPHHKASSSGIGPAVWAGVVAAMGALMGARGGVQIPSGERRGVYNHLSKHYKEFDKEPPDFKIVELVYYANLLKNDQLVVPSTSVLQKLEAIAQYYGSADPTDLRPVTEAVLRRVRIAEHTLF